MLEFASGLERNWPIISFFHHLFIVLHYLLIISPCNFLLCFLGFLLFLIFTHFLALQSHHLTPLFYCLKTQVILLDRIILFSLFSIDRQFFPSLLSSLEIVFWVLLFVFFWVIGSRLYIFILFWLFCNLCHFRWLLFWKWSINQLLLCPFPR